MLSSLLPSDNWPLSHTGCNIRNETHPSSILQGRNCVPLTFLSILTHVRKPSCNHPSGTLGNIGFSDANG